MKQIQILILNSLKYFRVLQRYTKSFYGNNFWYIRLNNKLFMNEIEMGNVEMNKHPIYFTVYLIPTMY